jgi:hypothetical protein
MLPVTLLVLLNLEDGTNTLSSNVSSQLPTYAMQHPRRARHHLHHGRSLQSGKFSRVIVAVFSLVQFTV